MFDSPYCDSLSGSETMYSKKRLKYGYSLIPAGLKARISAARSHEVGGRLFKQIDTYCPILNVLSLKIPHRYR